MSETVMQDGGTFLLGDIHAKDSAQQVRTPALDAPGAEAPPVGYRWVSKRWRVLPDGTRDYAAFHGKTAFTSLLPLSSKLRTPKR
jgi:hypothetical protein